MKEAAALEAGHRRNQLRAVAQSYRAARILRDDDAQWTDFCVRQVADLGLKKSELQRTKALQLAVLFTLGSTDTEARKQASLFVRALRPAFDGGVSATKIPSIIKKAGGFKALAAANGRRKSGRSAADQEGERKASEAPQPSEVTLPITARLSGKGQQLLSMAADAHVQLQTRVIGSSRHGFELAILDAVRIDPRTDGTGAAITDASV